MNVNNLTLTLIQQLIYAINRFLSFTSNSVSYLGGTIVSVLLIRILKNHFNYANNKHSNSK